MKTVIVFLLSFVGSFGLSAQEVDEKRQEVLRKLSSQRVSLEFENMFLEEIVDYLRASTGLNIIIHQEVLQRYGEDELRFTIRLKNLRLKSALKLLLGMRDLTATYRDGVLVIVSQDSVHRGVVTRVYDVRDLLFRIRDFPGPSVELASPGNPGGALTGATFTIEEEGNSPITEDFITEIITTNTAGNSWDENENVAITLVNGLLIVTQSGKAHREVQKLLNLLRQFK